jgi:ABC-type dipeptide/oligopeptide/nickel transport system ATPase component
LEDTLLDVKNLKTVFNTYDGLLRAVDGVDLQIKRGEAVGMVGEPGCGKSITSLSIMRLIPSPPGKIFADRIWFNGRDLQSLSETEIRSVRGNEISMFFQEPMTSLNPVFTIGDQICEALELHQGLKGKPAPIFNIKN